MRRQQQARDGDWTCRGCGFGPNFAFRSACFRCGGSHAAGGGGRQQQRVDGASRGPQGAGGSRPLLAVWAARDEAVREDKPTFRRPGSSVAAVEQHRAAAAASAAKLVQQGSGGVADRSVHGAGGGGCARGQAGQAANGGAPASRGCASADPGDDAAQVTHGRRRWADDVPPCDRFDDDSDGYADEDAAMDEEDVGDEDGEDWSWDYEPTPERLKARWEQECRAVRALERAEAPGEETSAALWAARRARDRAEEAWRNARTPKPVSVRMGFAQRKLDRAQRSLDKCREALAAHEEEAERRRCKLQEDIDAAEGRLALRQGQMDDLLREAGGMAAGGEGSGTAAQGLATDARRICDDLAKDLQAFIETLEEGTEARGRANIILSKFATAAASEDQRRFCIASDDAASGDEMEVDGAARRGPGARGSTEGRAPRGPPTCKDGAHGRWDRRGAVGGRIARDDGKPSAACGADGGGGTLATAEAASKDGHKAAGAAAAAACAARVGEEPRTGGAGANTRAREGDDEQPSAKSHRGHDEEQPVAVEGTGDDAARALRLQQEQNAAIQAAQSANATFGDAKSVQIAAQIYAQKVEQARGRAQSAGISPTCNGRQLIELSPDELNAWIRDVLTPAENTAAREDKEL